LHQGLVSEEVLEDCELAIAVTWLNPQRKYLVGFVAVATHKPKNITELKAIAHEEWAKILQKRCQKLVPGCTSCLQQVITAKGFSTKY